MLVDVMMTVIITVKYVEELPEISELVFLID